MILSVVKLHKDAIVPQKAHDGDAGYDLFALEDMVIEPNETVKVRTGIGVQIPYGYMGDVTGKSGLTSKTNLRVNRGIVDFGYQGEVSIIVTNLPSNKCNDNIHIKKGQKVAQMIITSCVPDKQVFVMDEFDTSSERGSGGFGSTGLLEDMDVSIASSILTGEPKIENFLIDKVNNAVGNGMIGG